MKKILIFSNEPLFPLTSGGRLRTWNFVKALSQDDNQLSLIFPHNNELKEEDLNEGRAHFKEMWNIPVKRKTAKSRGTILNRINRFFHSIPWEIDACYYPELDQALTKIIEENNFDYILVRYVYQAQYLFKLGKKVRGKVIIDLDDIETRKQTRIMNIEGHRTLYDKYRKKLNNAVFEKYHKDNLKKVDRCVVCSQEDKDYVVNKKWSENTSVIPNVLDIQKYKSNGTGQNNKTILFVGLLNYQPNVDGITWFAQKIFPKIRDLDKNVKLNIVGRDPVKTVLGLQNNNDIFVHASVKEVLPYYQNASLVVVPIRIAGGTRIKIIEAGAYNRPVIATTIGAEGLNLIDGKHCLIRDEEEQFAESCVEILHDKELSDRLVSENYRFVKENYDISTVSQKIKEMFQP